MAAGDVAVVTIADRVLDGESIQAVVRAVQSLAAQPGPRTVHLDFRNVVFLNGSGLGQLIPLHRQLQAAGGRLVLVNVEAKIYEVFVVTGVAKVLDVRPQEAG